MWMNKKGTLTVFKYHFSNSHALMTAELPCKAFAWSSAIGIAQGQEELGIKPPTSQSMDDPLQLCNVKITAPGEQ